VTDVRFFTRDRLPDQLFWWHRRQIHDAHMAQQHEDARFVESGIFCLVEMAGIDTAALRLSPER